jgi:histidine ammonia-lyase
MDDAMVLLGGRRFSVFELQALAAGSAPIGLTDGAISRIARAREIVAAYAAGDAPIYGLNTGLGGNLGHRIGRDEIVDFQAQLVRGRNVGVGAPLPELVCRSALLVRIISAADGGPGLSRSAIDALIALFNAGVTPVIPSIGSIGAGDLVLAAHMGAVLLGRGRAWFKGEELPGAEALERAGLKPVALEPKDGLALCNAAGPSMGHAVVTLSSLADALLTGAAVAALAYQGYGGNPAIFDARLHDARPMPGQRETAGLFRHLLAGSSVRDNPRNIQDALSFRTLAPVMGATIAAFGSARGMVEDELNGVSDTPLVLLEEGLMQSSPNFQTSGIALAFDTLAISLTHLATASAYRIFKLMNPALSGLPKYLSPVGGASAGFVPMQKTVSALHAEIRLYATPASLDGLAVSDTVEDHAPQTFLTIKKLSAQLAPFRLLTAIEALVAAQAADLRDGLRLSPLTAQIHAVIRAEVPMLGADREGGPDAMAVHDILGRVELTAAIRDATFNLKLPLHP